MEIIWSDDAIKDYHHNIDYLLKNWSEQVAQEFIEDVEATIDLISIHHEIYPLTDYTEIRRAVIRKQISLFFKVSKTEIYLIRFWNNSQNPKELKL